MAGLKEKRAEETRKAILTAAGKLFKDKGFSQISMREIAKEAGCSHTTIYLYFKDKEALLHHLSGPPLEKLHEQMQAIVSGGEEAEGGRLKQMFRAAVQFSLENRSTYSILLGTNATRVDTESPGSELNRLRLGLFQLMKQELGRTLELPDGERLLAFGRIYYYQLLGVSGTYSESEERTESLMERLSATFDQAVDVLLAGFRAQLSNTNGRD
ncbi:TetR/AcrR family transcriptional regulator [Paenibacillus aurantius]|uniref:TetR/AcrR family transcriptional regulator n=1 Tax=Paenibacillus aurantius TaxID=2918900 RepID=A0AA96L8L5_9BACL|nr:TetR/AcrR family transcriptional regulator [Paenibacillus aurantius]WNQ09022.1 TetR/AcrR family transcriptional regulator [Paenibacillus aurantius]